MTDRDAENAAKYRWLAARGFSREDLDELVGRSGRPAGRRGPVDRELAQSALRLDVLDWKIERARREQYEQTTAALQRLGFDPSRLGPPLPERLPGEPTHLERAIEGPTGGDARVGMNRPPGLLIRPGSGTVTGWSGR